jgi:hypothetical protein
MMESAPASLALLIVSVALMVPVVRFVKMGQFTTARPILASKAVHQINYGLLRLSFQ